MKKLIAVAAILSVMFLGAGTSHALLGVPDAVPGRDVLVPFFLVSMPGHGSDNSLITITNVNNFNYTGTASVHLYVLDSDSNVRFDKDIELTKWDVWGEDGLTIINQMAAGPPGGRAALEVDLDGDGTNDHWAGYLYIDNPIIDAVTGTGYNDFIVHAYQISVVDGIVAGYLPPALENYDAVIPMNARLGGYISADSPFNMADVEGLSADALWEAKCEQIAAAVGTVDGFRLMPRFYIHDADSTNLLIVWTDEELTLVPQLILPGKLHVMFYNEEELPLSSDIYIDRELNLIDLGPALPAGLHVDYPFGGWIDIATPDLLGLKFDARRNWLGYSLQRAIDLTGVAGTLDVIFEAHRDAAGTTTGPS